MKTCKKCDIIYGDDKKFCKKCGSSLSQRYDIEQKKLAKKTVFEERLKADPLNTSLLLEYAQFLYANLLYKEAISKLLIILAINQDQEQVKEWLYKCYFKLNLHKEALDIGEQLLEKRKTDITLLEKLAEIATELDNKEKIIEYCNTILELQPSNTKALYSKAIALLEQNEFENATAILTQLYKKGNRERIVVIYASINECLSGNYKEAVETLTPILLNEDPSLLDIHDQRALLYLTYSLCKVDSNIREVDRWFKLLNFKFINDFKHPVDEVTIAKTVIEMINIYFADKKLKKDKKEKVEYVIYIYINEANICFSEHTNSYVADIWNKIAEVQESANLLKEAQISLKKAIDLSPESAEYKDKLKHITEYLEEKKKKKKRHNTVFGISTILIVVTLTASYFIYNRHIENKAWETAKNSNTCESFQEFLESYPESKYFRLGKKSSIQFLRLLAFQHFLLKKMYIPLKAANMVFGLLEEMLMYTNTKLSIQTL